VVDVKKIEIHPNKCPIDAELGLTIHFDIAQDVKAAVWEVKV